MITVIGKKNCSRCEIARTILKNRGIEYEYKFLEDLPQDSQDELVQLASEKGITSMPLILYNSMLVTLEEVQ